MHKLSHLQGTEWIEHSYPALFTEYGNESEVRRVVAGVPGGDGLAFERLLATMEPPYILLYVLHTPRGEGEEGRYQSPELSPQELTSFLSQFRAYLSSDARFDIWGYSPQEKGTVVWDRHNQLFAYGPIAKFTSELLKLGFRVGPVEVPVPHQHHYRAEFDGKALDLLRHFSWSHSPLRPEDEQ